MTEKQLERAQEIRRELNETQKIIQILSDGYKQLNVDIAQDFRSVTLSLKRGNISRDTLYSICAILMNDARERKERLKKEFEAL